MTSASPFRRLWLAAVRKFVRDPAGFGRPVPAAAFDEEYRSGRWDHFSSFAELPRSLVLAGAIRHFFPDGAAILDVGAGSGRLAQLVQAHPFHRYLGIDLSPEGVARAQRLALPRMEFQVADFETWRPAGTFHAIVFNESIGYAADPAATLAAFARHLTPDGLFFVSLYRSSLAGAQWRRILTVTTAREAASVGDDAGRTWDLRVLQPRR